MWNSIIKPFVTYSVGSLSKQELITLLKAIVNNEKELIESTVVSHPHAVFYDVVTVLSAHVVTAATVSDFLSRSNFPLACQAARILCESLLKRLPQILRSPHPILTVKIFVSVIQEFCNGVLVFSEEDTANMLALLRTQELPPKIQSTAPSSWDKEGTAAAVKEVRRNRLDPSVLLYDQIAMPVMSMPTDKPLNELFAQEVRQIFQTMRAGQKLVEYFLSLPTLKTLYPEVVNLNSDSIRSFISEVHTLKNPSMELVSLTEELNLVYRFLSIPLFAPLTSEDSHSLNQLAIGVLNGAFAVLHHIYGSLGSLSGKSASNNNLSDSDYQMGVVIVSQAIWTNKRIIQILKEDTGLPQWSWLNCSLALSKILFVSLHSYMVTISSSNDPNQKSEKSSSSKECQQKMNLTIVQQLWNELANAILSHGIKMAKSFVRLISSVDSQGTLGQDTAANLLNFKNDLRISNGERIQFFFDGQLNIIELMVETITLSYRRACRLKSAEIHEHDRFQSNENKALTTSQEDDSNGNNLDILDPNTLEIDDTNDVEVDGDNNSVSDLMTTEDEDEREEDHEDHYDIEYDDEPFLGKWLESVLNPPEIPSIDAEVHTVTDKKTTDDSAGTDGVKALTDKYVKDKDSAVWYTKSGLTVLNFLTKKIVSSQNALIKGISLSSFNEQTVALLALIIKDLDQEKAATEIGAISSLYDDDLNRIFVDFSAEIGKLIQNLLAQGILTQDVLKFFLDQLGIDLYGTGRWALGLQSRALAVLVQVILLKAQDKETLVACILKRVLETISEDISTVGTPPHGYADLPVEHAQTLVFLFHTLSLMQKKAVMIDTARAVINVSNNLSGHIKERHQLLSLSRLLLLFDYFIRQLYEPSLSLISHVQYNLFNEDGSANATVLQPHSTTTAPSKSFTSKPTVLKKHDYNFPGTGNMATNNLNGSAQLNEPPSTKPLSPARMFYDNPVRSDENNERSYDVKPKFYNLIRVEPNYQENPTNTRLDGLAMNFLMNKNDVNFKDKMSYSEVIEAVLRFVELRIEDSENINIQQYIQYFLTRLVFGLPPPHEFLLKLEETHGKGDWLVKHPGLLLYLIVWLPRLQNRIYSSWIRDIFSKQGLSTMQSEELAKRTGIPSFASAFVFPFLESASNWVNKTESQTPVYFYALEAAIVFAHENLDSYFPQEKERTPENIDMENSLISTFTDILHSCMDNIRKFVYKSAYLTKSKKRSVSLSSLELSTNHLMSIASSYLMQNCMAKIVIKNLDPELKTVMEKYLPTEFPFDENFPDFTSTKFNSDLIPSESYLLAIINGHSGHVILQINALKHILGSIIKLFGAAINGKNGKKVGAPQSRKDKMSSILFPLLFDRVGEYLGETIGVAIDPIYTKTDVPLNAKLVDLMANKTLACLCYPELRSAMPEQNQDNFLEESFQALSNLLPEFGSAFVKIVTDNNGDLMLKLLSLLMKTECEGVLTKLCEFLSMLLSQPSSEIASIIFTKPDGLEDLPTKIFKLEFFQNEATVEAACKFFSALLDVLRKGDKSASKVVKKILLSTISVTKANLKDHREQQYKKDDKPRYVGSVHKCKVRPASFPHLLKILIQMAGCAEDDGHAFLFRQMLEWLKEYGEDLPEQFEYERQGTYDEDIIRPASLDSYAIITDYMLDIGKAVQAVCSSGSIPGMMAIRLEKDKEREGTPGSSTPPNETDDAFDLCDSEIGDEQGGEDSGGEDSDDEGLNSRLCTYTITQKEFMSQHWYHCHTCGMIDGVGVCSICARVCHRGHDVTYAKFGSFFCDCGAKTDGSCLALVRRPNAAANTEVGNTAGQAVTTSSVVVSNFNPFVSTTETGDSRRASSPTLVDYKTAISTNVLFNSAIVSTGNDSSTTNFPSLGGEINIKGLNWSEIMLAFKEFSANLPLEVISKLKDVTNRYSSLRFPCGKLTRVQVSLRQLRKSRCRTMKFATAEDLVIPTLGSQEGAFENIKMQYNGDQGSTIRQLINSQVIRRTTIASLSAPTARRHFLAVSQEKGKVSVLQLGALLSGAEAGKKKLTLPRLATLTLPFTALTMTSNPLRDDVLAVCGLKDCHVLVIGTGGAISSHLVLQLQLESQNHVIKPMWIPGSQTELCIIMNEAVKIYDLAEDIVTPVYCFLLPTGRVRDATFMIQNRDRYIAIMSNDGRIYFERLSNVNPMNGPYYITQDLNYNDEEMIALNESNASSSENKGVSLYYSHYLKLLFYTYPNGKSYVSTLDDIISEDQPLQKQSLISPRGAAKPATLGLAQWTEVVGHPGLVFAMAKDSTPYVLFLSPKGGMIQEIRMLGKIKPIDIVALRHGHHQKMKTSLLILCDDGSLRVCDATESTEFWINPRLRPQYETSVKPSKKNNSSSKKVKLPSRTPTGQLSFPTDFFEHCQPMNDVDYGGNDLLQIYNVAQLRNRVNNPGMYVVSTKSIGFNLEVSNNDGSMVMTGVRILLGSQDVNRAPSFIQIFGRTITVNLIRPRWYDIPLTREESLQADSKLTITFGPSNDPQCVTFVDTVKIYGKNKDSFGWPDDSDEVTPAQSTTQNGTTTTSNGATTNSSVNVDHVSHAKKNDEDALLEKVVVNSLDLCEIAVTLCSHSIVDGMDVKKTLKDITYLYTENFPVFVPPCRNLLLALKGSKTAYYDFRDQEILDAVISVMKYYDSDTSADNTALDVNPEQFCHILNCLRNVAVTRPQHITQYNFPPEYPLEKVMEVLAKVFDHLLWKRSSCPHIESVDYPGIQRVEAVSMAFADTLVSIMMHDLSTVNGLARQVLSLLLSQHRDVSVPVRTLLVKKLRPKNVRKRRVTIPIPGPSPPHCPSPDTGAEDTTPSGGARNVDHVPLVEVDEPIVMLGHENEAQMPIINALDAFMGADGFGVAPGLQSDAEDEAMVELAIALSLQEQVGGAALAIQGIQEGLQALEEMHQEVLHVAEVMSPEEAVHLDGDVDGGVESDGDATASPPPSDDEGSTVATDGGSTMRNSEPGGSESSGSSGGGGSVNGRNTRESGPRIQAGSSSSDIQIQGESQHGLSEAGSSKTGRGSEKESSNKPNQLSSSFVNAKPFRLALMKYFAKEIPAINGALDLIPLLQVMLVILAELDGTSDDERVIVSMMVQNLVDVMCLEKIKPNMQWLRDDQKERTLIALRMLSILVSRWRGAEARSESSWIARITADIVLESSLLKKCKELLMALRSTWRGEADAEENVTPPPPFTSVPSAQTISADSTVNLLKPYTSLNPPDFSPFFLKQYIKTHCNDILEELPLLLSEMALRFPYQVKKIIDADKSSVFDTEWEELLCEILQNRNAPFVRRQARKLLLNIAGTRDKYHLLRDLHNIKYHLSEFKFLIGYREAPVNDGTTVNTATKVEFKYSQLVSMVEQLNTCIDIATQRSSSWQSYCRNENSLKFIIQISCTADESLTTAILSLLKIAIDGLPFDSKNESPMVQLSEEEKVTKSLAHQVIDTVEKRTFLEFVKKFLLEHPVLTTRWQAHSLLLGFFLTSDCAHQLKLVNAMWELWPFVPAAGIRAAQFVDILGYATLNNEELKSKDLRKQVSCCIESIESQGYTLLAHPNASIYASLVPFVSVEGFYLESEPCEVCYNIDKPYTTQKLNSIKADAKFTANSQIIKLASTLSVIRLSIRLTEVKKARMIKKMVVYYSPKNLPIVELKNKPLLWQMARLVMLSPSQTEIKLDFSVPITAANIMLEFLEFYDNVQATSETLQCPRCSASVPAQPGVCSNCGENVFQCHKCRAINYDERDPFLCHSCGFCKYAKMDISLLAKNVVAVDPIENEEDHKKAEMAVSSLLEKADQTYKQQQQMKGCLETMLQSIKERRSMAGVSPTTLYNTASANTVSINLGSAPAPQSYAAVAAAANALNNNVQSNNNGVVNAVPLAGVSGTTAQVINSSAGLGSTSSLVLKNVQSLAYCYAIDCKNSYEELNRVMRKVGAYRREMLKLDPTSYSLDTMDTVTYRRCYGCMASSITLSLKLLQALITPAESPRDPFDPFFLSFLLRLSQSAGSTADFFIEQVKNALCFFVKDDAMATIQLTDMITSRVMVALNKESWSDVSFETSEEISLLASLLQMYDSCWEIKLRSLMGIFTHAIKRLRDPAVTEAGLLPCLKIIQDFIRATQGGDKEKATVEPVEGVYINLQRWINGEEGHSFERWKKKLPKPIKIEPKKKMEGKSDSKEKLAKKEAANAAKEQKRTKAEGREIYLMKTYGRLWLEKFLKLEPNPTLKFDSDFMWLKKLIFCPGSVQTRAVTAALLKDLSQIPLRRLKIMELLTSFMEDLPASGESCREFMELYRDLATPAEYSQFLNAKGALNIVCKLLDDHIDKLHYLEAVTLHSDLSQGIAVLELTRLLSALAIPSVRRTRRVSLLSTVLRGYLALKRLRLHRTRPIEEAQEILLQLLEEITTGTEEETKVFMSVCVETLKKCPKDDLATPVFVFERLCSLIVHEENEVAEFFMTLDKDPQQEDFLQGRMLGNPYSSNESGVGPLMRDIKNKICTDCELVALLEDDNGMELLVNNRIISLDLPVKEVYKRIWLPTNGQIEPMRIVYRMRGLLGDATEEFVESFASATDGPEDNELTYKLANVLVDCGGLKVVLNSLENLMSLQFKLSGAKPLIAVNFKLLGYSSKIKAGRLALLDPDLNAVQILLPVLRLCLEYDLIYMQGSSGVVHLTDQVLELLDTILSDACALEPVAFERFAKSRGSIEEFSSLLALTQKLKNKPSTATTTTLFKVLAALAYTDKEKMTAIFDMYNDCWDFVYFIDDHTANRSHQGDYAYKMEQLCTLVSNIEEGPYGNTFKDLAFERQIVKSCLDYIKLRAPSLTPPMGRPDSDEWKEMVSSKPSLKYVLRLLAGFASNHVPSQEAIKDSIYVIHQLEQVSSDEHVGSLAENTLEALRSHKQIWKEVEAARRATREEKKKMAMAMRQRQLSTMGMKTNDRGQVTAVSTMLDHLEELAEETGLICVICREGYKYQPNKVLGIYTYSKRCLLEEHELKSRKTYGYCTVSHFNVVHVDCHMAAIRLARSRDEWESASLQNANTRCNGLIPLWGQQVPESAFAACLARHNAYLQEATGNRDVGFSSGAHDIKLLLLRFAEEKTFHEDTGGGGPESNMHLIPYLFHTALYVLNTTRAALKESSAVDKFLNSLPSTWKDDASAIDGVYYHLVVSLAVNQPDKWMENRIMWLKRVIALCGVRSKKYRSSTFDHCRSGLIFLSLIHGFYTIVFKDVSGSGEWPSMLADYIRRNDEPLVKSTSALLSLYQQKLVTAKTFSELLEVLGIHEKRDLKDFDSFMKELWDAVA